VYGLRMRGRSLSLGLLLFGLACGAPREQTLPSTSETGDSASKARDGWRAFVGPRFIASADDPRDYEAVVVDERGRIVSLHETRANLPPVRVIELDGALALPGLHDAHLHIAGIGRRAREVDLRGVRSVDELRERVRRHRALHPEGSAITGRGFDQSLFPGGLYPTAADLDDLADVPIVLRRVDGHAALVDRATLARAGVTRETRDPEGGRIVRDDAGEPTGVLIDHAMALVDPIMPVPTLDERVGDLLRGLEACADAGLTSVHDMGMSPGDYISLATEALRAKLPVRVYVYLDGADPKSLTLLDKGKRDYPRVSLRGIKIYADGAMGSRGALLHDDYSDAPGHKGLALTDEKTLTELVRHMKTQHAQVAIHAIGDAAVTRAIDAIVAVDASGRARHRIEHAQLVVAPDVERMARAGIVASMQPVHATSDMHWILDRVGPERARLAYAWRTMRTQGVPLAFGSDAPVESERVTLSFFAALTRRPPVDGDAPALFPEERLFFAEALDAFTRGAAFAVHDDDAIGVLAPGHAFDVTLLDADPRAEPARWRTVRPVATIVEGQLRAVRTP